MINVKSKNQITDIKHVDIKRIYGENYRFITRNCGYVVLQGVSHNKKDGTHWATLIHTVDIESCLQYIFRDNNSKGEVLVWENLETV